MGAKDSKRSCLLYEEAVKRVSDAELKRVCEAFKRLTGGGQLLSKSAFIQNVLGDGIPLKIAECLYVACGGGPRGIAQRDLICGLVLLTKGTQEEKIKFLWTLYCNDSGTFVSKTDFLAALQREGTFNLNGTISVKPNDFWDKTLTSLFGKGQDKVSFEHFRAWIQFNKEATVLSRWLLATSCVSLSSEVEMPTFYQTLAGVTHLEEQDICELEKCFWSLQSSSPSGHLDVNCVTSLISPPVPTTCCHGLFLALDVNRDDHVDFKELCCGISAACRGPTAERMKFCFKIFDMDRDGQLNKHELQHMIDILLFVAKENKVHFEMSKSNLDRNSEGRTSKESIKSLKMQTESKNGDHSTSKTQNNISTTQNTINTTQSNEKTLFKTESNQNNDTVGFRIQNYERRTQNNDNKIQSNEYKNQNNENKTQNNELKTQNSEKVAFKLQGNEFKLQNNENVDFQVQNNNITLQKNENFVYKLHNDHSFENQFYTDGNSSNRRPTLDEIYSKLLMDLKQRLSIEETLTQEEFLMWAVNNNVLVAPLLELLFQVCHVSLGLKPHCRHHEREIVMGWLDREERRGYSVGQFWYLVSSEWWQAWINYTTAPRNSFDHCTCRPEKLQVEEGIVCDESFTSNFSADYTLHSNSNEFTSNSTDSMGDLMSRGDSCSIASSSGVSSSSGTGAPTKRTQNIPGPIDNSNLVAESLYKVGTLTGEGGRLKRDTPLVQRRDFELIPDSLWKALALWYEGPLPLPRQVIRPPGSLEVELELYPLNLRILRHQTQTQNVGGPTTWSTVVGGYGAAALSSAGITTAPVSSPRRYLAHTAAFSRLANVKQVIEFLSARLSIKLEDIRVWHVKETNAALLEDEFAILQDLGIQDGDQLLLEVRNKDLTWPEELGALASGSTGDKSLLNERRPTISLPPGATGLHNLGNTCFMNAALQAVSNTRPLTLYFQRDSQLCELNSSNPLGTKGQVARRYAELVRELWAGSTRSVAPLKLRWCVSKHAPHLGGGGQHDSQELLAWLLDALHEDLNRVTRKQYTELRDSDGRPDSIVAQEAWNQHLARDHSIITDLFYGQLKSKVTCIKCKHESVRFDAFNLLSLPLPMESFTLCEVLVVKLNGEIPIKYGLRLNSEAKYSELKKKLEELCEIPALRLFLAEIASSQIKQVLLDESRINPGTALEIYAYELPGEEKEERSRLEDEETELDVLASQSPLARSPENNRSSEIPRNIDGVNYKKASISVQPTFTNAYTDIPSKPPNYLIAVHRKCVRQETYFLSQHKSKPSLFGLPLLLGCNESSTCQSVYESVWGQVTRLLSPMPLSDQTNHATDCDDSLGYEFPFTLKAVLQGGNICALCHWSQFCRGCKLPCNEELLFDFCSNNSNAMWIAIDWDPTALHLRYQSGREKVWIEHESVKICKKLHTEPIDLDYCLKAFTSEEKLEAKYHCSNCNDKQNATKKLQIWRLPPILIIHLKRFDFVNSKWVKTQKVVNFPFKNFDPTAYLASVPQETILRHHQLVQQQQEEENEKESLVDVQERIEEEMLINGDEQSGEQEVFTEKKLVQKKKEEKVRRQRLESTSLIKTPIIDGDLRDYHEHNLLEGQDKFDLKYQLYAVVSHSGMLNGGHYICYSCNPNGHWYCYNDSSCREVATETENVKNANLKLRENTKFESSRQNSNCENSPLNCNLSASSSNLTQSNSLRSNSSSTLIGNNSYLHGSVDNLKSGDFSTENSPRNSPNLRRTSHQKLNGDFGSKTSLNSFKCAYSDMKIPKIDTSSAYILFYERSGLNYRPYLPEIASNNLSIPEVELEESESELRKQLCNLQ